MTVLKTQRLTLRPCHIGDVADFIALEHDPDVMRFLNGGLAVDRAADNSEANFLIPDGTETSLWTAVETAGGGFAGWFGLWPDGKRQAELGYRLRRAVWGQGFAPEGARALIDWGFSSAGYDTIAACTMTVNLASRRVMEKIGMAYARTVPFDGPAFPGTEEGEVWYEVSRQDWTPTSFG